MWLKQKILRPTGQKAKFTLAALAAVAIPATANAQGSASINSAFELIGVILLFLTVIAAFFKILAHDADKHKPAAPSDSPDSTNKHIKPQGRKYRSKHS